MPAIKQEDLKAPPGPMMTQEGPIPHKEPLSLIQTTGDDKVLTFPQADYQTRAGHWTRPPLVTTTTEFLIGSISADEESDRRTRSRSSSVGTVSDTEGVFPSSASDGVIQYQVSGSRS